MENTYGNKQPLRNNCQVPMSPMKPQKLMLLLKLDPELKNPFVISGIRNLKLSLNLMQIIV
jgi:hypothetical protein